MLVGVRQPEVVLPLQFLQNCNEREQRLILAHELAHLRCRNLQWEWLRLAVRPLFFFHPLIRLADSEWHLAQELACDELTLRSTAALPVEYGKLLVRVATGVPRERLSPGPSLGIGEAHASLRRRLRALGSLRPLPRAQMGAAVIAAGRTGALRSNTLAGSRQFRGDLPRSRRGCEPEAGCAVWWRVQARQRSRGAAPRRASVGRLPVPRPRSRRPARRKACPLAAVTERADTREPAVLYPRPAVGDALGECPSRESRARG